MDAHGAEFHRKAMYTLAVEAMEKKSEDLRGIWILSAQVCHLSDRHVSDPSVHIVDMWEDTPSGLADLISRNPRLIFVDHIPRMGGKMEPRESSDSRSCNANTIGRRGSSAGSRPSLSTMKWIIVVDTSSVLDKESRKSLQLLQGVRGTHLVIPRAVLRELGRQKCCCSMFFRRTGSCPMHTAGANVSSALEWIDECMAETEQWVHIESASEETEAKTPHVSPSVLVNVRASEDYVLNCALLHRERNSGGQPVLLSSDRILKIKARAVGVICETAQEFCESLVNPCSERFMFAEGSPRDRYNEKSSKGEGSAKGLKLLIVAALTMFLCVRGWALW